MKVMKEAIEIICENQEVHGDEVPYIECLLLRRPIETAYKMFICSYENCPLNKFEM